MGQILNSRCQKMLEDPVFGGVLLVSLGHSPAHVNIRGGSTAGGRNMVFRKSSFGWVELACPTLLLVDPNSPHFFRRTQEESLSIKCISDFRYLDPFSRYSGSNSEVVRNRPEFVFSPQNIWCVDPEFWHLDYKTEPTSDHAAKFLRRSSTEG